MDTLYRTNLAVHVLSGFVGLSVMLIPLLSRKGGRAHRRFGWTFVVAMSFVAVSGIEMSLVWLAAPERFRPSVATEQVLVDAAFLALIGALTLNALSQAIFALRQKGRSHPIPSILVKMLLGLLAACAVTSLGLGMCFRDPLSLVFGVGALLLLAQDLRFTFGAFASPHAYLYQHINAMGTACISALTAFLVLGARRTFSTDVLGPHAWLLWLAPSALFAPLFQLWIVRYRQKLERPRRGARNADEPDMRHA